MIIYCAGCRADVEARLTDGAEIYPNRAALAALPFWVCDGCKSFVGTHHKTASPTRPLGVLATPELRAWRMKIHAALDPIWKEGRKVSRGNLYYQIAKKLGREFHVSNIKSDAEAREAYEVVMSFRNQLGPALTPWNR